MMTRTIACAALVAITLAGCASSRSTVAPPASGASLAQERATDLMVRARTARQAGHIGASLEFYQRAAQFSGATQAQGAREMLQLLDGLRIETVSGSRQAATASSPPRLPLMARVVLDPGRAGAATPAVGVPMIWKWSDGATGEVLGERSSDESGMVTLRVSQMPDIPNARLDVGFDMDRIPLPRGAADPDVQAAIRDAEIALAGRHASFEFLPVAPAAKSRVIIIIDEQVFERAVDQSLVSDRLTTTLVDRGVKVVGSTEMGKSDYDKLRQSFNPDEWNALAPALARLCDYVVYGHVQVRQDYVNQGGGMWAVARGRVSLYGTYRPEIMASVDFSNVAGFAGDTWQNAAEDCLRKCADMTTKKLVPLVVQVSGQ